jgi:lipid-binding SYLF domain-containing protein
MSRSFPPCLALGLVVTGLAAGPAAAQRREIARIDDATEVLVDLQTLKIRGIPARLMADAQGVAIFPHVVKGGFLIGGRVGHGVVVTRNAAGGWDDPVFAHLGGASIGFQAGVQAADVVLVFKTRNSLDRILKGKRKLTLGADASVAAGPVGRQAEAGTDARMQAEVYSYSRARGLFAGVALGGAVIHADPDGDETFGRFESAEKARAVARLKAKLTEMSVETRDDLPPRKIPPADRR